MGYGLVLDLKHCMKVLSPGLRTKIVTYTMALCIVGRSVGRVFAMFMRQTTNHSLKGAIDFTRSRLWRFSWLYIFFTI